MAHPLSGANIGTLVDAFRRGGKPDRWLSAVGIFSAAAGRSLASLGEAALVHPRLPTVEEMAPPVFIIGHWRSGTTHLYNILGQGEYGYVPPVAVGLPWDMAGLGRALGTLLERSLPETRWIDSVPVTPTSPQEDEIAIASMCDVSFYHGIYFPRHFDALIDRGLFFDGCSAEDVQLWEERFLLFMRKIAWMQGRPLIIKNPVYTARVDRLRRLFPGAKFIFMHRDPTAVFLSMCNFYRKLLPVMALQKVPDTVDVEATVFRVYDRMMQSYLDDRNGIEPGHLLEIAYDDLSEDPLGTVERIYSGLRLEGFERSRPAFERYIDSVAAYQRNVFRQDEAVETRVRARWGPWYDRFGYDAGQGA